MSYFYPYMQYPFFLMYLLYSGGGYAYIDALYSALRLLSEITVKYPAIPCVSIPCL